MHPGTFHEATEDTWEAAPPSTPAKAPSPWEPLLEFVAAGKIASIPITDPTKLRGLRIGLARLAAGRQMKLIFRATDHELLVRKSAVPYQKAESRADGDTAPSGRRQRGRRKES